MPRYCCVPECKTYGGHRFPADKALSLKWRIAIRRCDERSKALWKPSAGDVVCHLHFTEQDYKTTLLDTRKQDVSTYTLLKGKFDLFCERCRLKKDAVPSIFPFCKSETASSTRQERLAKRTATKSQESGDLGACEDVQCEVEVESYSNVEEDLMEVEETEDTATASVSSQCNLPGPWRYRISQFQNDDRAVNYYTGFKNYEQFLAFFHCLGPCVDELDYQCSLLEPIDQLFLTIMKLRQAKEDVELSMFFGVSESTVCRLVVTWINFMYFQLKELDMWPDQEIVQEFMPTDFARKFPQTRVILDATEIPIHKPSNVNSQSTTWSSYKHRNTLKTMIGCTPKGAVCFISDTYGGSTSDRQIIERSDLLKPELNMFVAGDSIMADRGIMVQDLLAGQNVYVNTPTLLKGKSQLDPEEVVHDRRVASKRIHIERVIGLAKCYKILKKDLPQSKLQLGNRIVFVCFAIVNFRNSIVGRRA